MSGRSVPALLIGLILVFILVVWFGFHASTVPAPAAVYAAPAGAPLVEIVDTTAGTTSWGAPEFHGTVKSDTGVAVTAVIAADIYDASGRLQLATGESEVGIDPYGQSPYEVIIHRFRTLPENAQYRVYVENVY
jgi:hypothetical protein